MIFQMGNDNMINIFVIIVFDIFVFIYFSLCSIYFECFDFVYFFFIEMNENFCFDN